MKHTEQFYRTHLTFKESVILPTQKDLDRNYYLNNPWGMDAFKEYADNIKCWFEISDGRKCRSINLSKFTKLPLTTPNRLISLMLYCLYNGGLEKLSYQDLEYIYYQIRAYGKKYYY